METLYLPKNNRQRKIDFVVVDSKKKPKYHVTGTTGKKGDVLYVYDLKENEVSRIRQVSTSIIPRFQLLNNDNYVASFSLNFGPLRDLIYISHLNWIITGNIPSGKYRIRWQGKKILNVSITELPDGLFNELEVALENHEGVMIAIVALLDSWALIKKRDRGFNFKPKFRAV